MAEGEKWRWVEGGLELLGDMRAYIPEISEIDLQAFTGRANRVAEIRAVLESARQAFAGAQAADYSGAFDRVDVLLEEIRRGKREWGNLLDRLSAFFQPRLNLRRLSYAETEKFTYDAILHLSERLAKQKAKAESAIPKGEPPEPPAAPALAKV